jgi:hypothetical protein
VATVTAAEDPRPAPVGIIERTSIHRGSPFQTRSIALFTYAYRGSSREAPSAIHVVWGRA